MNLLIATTNSAKLTEINKFFGEFLPELNLVRLKDLGIEEGPEETGETFEENAIQKARFYAERAGMIALADDGGLEIDALNGEPGVLSRRWPGYRASDQELVDLTFEKLKGVPTEKRRARLRVAIVVVNSQGEIVVKEEERVEGEIALKPDNWIMKDFPFRAVLYLPQFNKYLQNLTKEEHSQINHRRKIIQKIAVELRKYL